MGSFLLTETMSRHREFGMNSYDRLEPHPDQWSFLNTFPTMTASDTARIAAEGRRIGNVIGVPLALTDEEHENAPWARAAHSRHRAIRRGRI
jgi:hypothetical protein